MSIQIAVLLLCSSFYGFVMFILGTLYEKNQSDTVEAYSYTPFLVVVICIINLVFQAFK